MIVLWGTFTLISMRSTPSYQPIPASFTCAADRSMLSHGCGRIEIGTVPAPHVVARCYGRPNPGVTLIHAATMVVAGVYMIARLYPVFYEGFSITRADQPHGFHWWIHSTNRCRACSCSMGYQKVLAYQPSPNSDTWSWRWELA